ncbi:MAG TPA: AAA family ATPase [Nitriliruptorales bacterium]
MPVEGSTATSLPHGTVTLVLGDVEGSVGLWERAEEAMRAARRRLDRIVVDAAGRHGGAIPLEQGEGDSFVVAFERASDAAAFAVDTQCALVSEPWPDGADIRVRVGVHTGEIDLREGRFYEGATINRCARLRDLGHGGQVLLSQATRDIVGDRLPDGTQLDDLGEHALRGFDRPEHVHAIRHPDLPEPGLPLRDADPQPAAAHVTVPLTTLIGRETEREQVRELLSRYRMVTLTGAGGSGKTRLASEVARDVADSFEHGVCWVDLAPLAEPALLGSTVATALGVRESASREVLEVIVREVGGDDRLLVLDNCEHLVDACADLTSGLLAGCPRLVVLATSREPLGVIGEATYRVPSLSVPPDADQTISSVAASEAAQLFLDRASLVQLGGAYIDADAAAIAAICRRLDGIPLAIELAAARTRLMTPVQILEGLADRFHLLTGGSRTAMPRQRTLEASVDWSYHLLAPPERTLLARLSVFAGSFDLEEVTVVCAGDPIDPPDVLDMLSLLVDRSLVQVEHSSGRARYRLLETLRVYARQKLTDVGEAATVRDRHLGHYVRLAEAAGDHLRSHEAATWLARLDDELPNLRAAMDWALTSRQPDQQLRISGSLLVYWILRSIYAEIRLRMLAALEAATGDDAVRARALSAAALVSVMAGENRLAQALAREGVDISRRLGDERSLQACLLYLGWASLFVGESGLDHLDEALAIADDLDDPLLRRLAWFYGAVARAELSSLDAADPWFDRTLTAATEAGDAYAVGVGCFFRGAASFEHGRLVEAAELLDRAVDVNASIGNESFVVFAASARAYVAALRGDVESATRQVDEIRDVAHRIGSQAGLFAEAMEGGVLLMRGELAAAVVLLADTADRMRAAGNLAAAAICLWLEAEAAALCGDVSTARSAVEQSQEMSDRGGFRWSEANSRRVAGRLALLEGDVARAAELLHDALDVFVDRRDPLGTVWVLEALAEVTLASQDHERGVRLLAAADAESGRRDFARPGPYEDVLARVLDQARSALGDEGFRAAWEDGGRVSLEAAVAYARRGISSRSTEQDHSAG